VTIVKFEPRGSAVPPSLGKLTDTDFVRAMRCNGVATVIADEDHNIVATFGQRRDVGEIMRIAHGYGTTFETYDVDEQIEFAEALEKSSRSGG
jgi:hypothetical protein